MKIILLLTTDMSLPNASTEGPFQYHTIRNRQDGILGVCFMKKEAVLPLHRHPQHETYLIVQGNARVTVGDRVTNVCSPHVIDIPGNVPHQIEARSGDLVFFYAYEEGPYESVVYEFESKLPRINGVVPENIPAALTGLDLNKNSASSQSPQRKFVNLLLMDKEKALSLGNIG